MPLAQVIIAAGAKLTPMRLRGNKKRMSPRDSPVGRCHVGTLSFLKYRVYSFGPKDRRGLENRVDLPVVNGTSECSGDFVRCQKRVCGIARLPPGRNPDRGPGQAPGSRKCCKTWIPAIA